LLVRVFFFAKNINKASHFQQTLYELTGLSCFHNHESAASVLNILPRLPQHTYRAILHGITVCLCVTNAACSSGHTPRECAHWDTKFNLLVVQ